MLTPVILSNVDRQEYLDYSAEEVENIIGQVHPEDVSPTPEGIPIVPECNRLLGHPLVDTQPYE